MINSAPTSANPDRFPSMPGYTIGERLYASDRTLVYRAVRDRDGWRAILKFPPAEYPSPIELGRLRHQLAIAQNLVAERGIVRCVGLETWKNRYVLVMEDCGSISLGDYIQTNALSLADILNIALQLTDILHILYRSRIVHKDIKPANILIHPATKQIDLIDFSIASVLPLETIEIRHPNYLEGTLAYLAPEQTGRMNRGVDYRSDFYALGVTLFELLTGRLPFICDDPLELVYCHLAKLPVPPDRLNSQMPQMVSAIVLKLMAKNAEDRYQSAIGLKQDLQSCLNQWLQTGTIPEFTLAQQDISDRFIIPDRLYGRETEVKTLLDAFSRVTAGQSELMLIAGYSGVGKTAVVNEIHKPLLQQRGYFMRGKFDQFNRHLPLSAFIQAFRDLMAQLLSESDAQLAKWKSHILSAVGENGQILIELIPELAKIIGTQAAAPELTGTAAQNRFNLVLQNFLRVFTTADHPLTIFLDDLQWADLASLNLMQAIVTEQQCGYLFLIGSYRDNEVSPADPMMLTLEAIAQAGVNIGKIELLPLNRTSLHQLVNDTLKSNLSTSQPLAKLIYQRTKGNPFFVTQLLKQLMRDELIKFNLEAGCWQYDWQQIVHSALTDDVLELMGQQLHKLPECTQTFLKIAACIGSKFDLSILAIVAEQSEDVVAENLWIAMQEGLILTQNQTYKFYRESDVDIKSTIPQKLAYKFLHDRVQQAAYSLISEADKQATHLKIGQLLLERSDREHREEHLLEIVNHLNAGILAIDRSQDRENLARLNLAAAKKAKAATAYQAAIEYLETGIELLPADCWHNLYELTLNLYQEITDACYLNSNFAELEKWAVIVSNNAPNLIDTINVQQNRIGAATVQGNSLQSVEIGLEVLRSLGLEFPSHPSQTDIQQAFIKTRQLWAEAPIDRLLELPLLTDPDLLAQMEILTVLSSAAYVSAPDLMPLLVCRQVEISIQFGNSPISVFAYGDYGVILCGVIGDIDSGYAFGNLSLQLRDKLQLSAAIGRNLFVNCMFIKHWKDSLSAILPMMELAYQRGIETGDLESANLNAAFYCIYAYYQGLALPELLKKIDIYRQTIVKQQHYQSLFSQSICHQAILNLIGKNYKPDRLSGEIIDADNFLHQLRENNSRAGLCGWYIHQTILHYLFHDYEAADRVSGQAVEYLDGGTSSFSIVIHSWFDTLIQLQRYSCVSITERQTISARVQQQQDKLKNWASFAPTNHQHRWELVVAERYRVEGNKIDAIEYYDRAIFSAKTNGFIQDEALANELAAKFYLDWGRAKFAAIYMQEAYNCYQHWGATAKTQHLERKYPQLLTAITEPVHPEPIASDRISESGRQLSAALDLDAAIEANQAISSEINLDRLLERLIQLMITNAGADKAALFLNNDGVLELGVKYFDRAFQSVEFQTVDKCRLVPQSLIRYVERTHATIVTDDRSHISTVNDPYCLKFRPQSLLCMPILDRGQLVGVLYLENAIAANIFTQERVKLLNVLCTQAAISLTNARLYAAERDKTEKLQASELRLKTIFERASDAIILWDESGFIDCNQAALDLFKYQDKSQLLSLHPYQISPEFQLDGISSLAKSQQITPQIFALGSLKIEWLHQRSTGEIFDAEVTLTAISDGGKEIIHALIRNISDRKRLKSEQQRLLDVLEATPDYIGIASANGKILWHNKQLRELRQDLVSHKNISECHPAWVNEIILNQVFPMLMEKGSWSGELALLDSDGKEIPVSQVIIAHKSQSGELECVSTIMRDISERKGHEEHLEQTNAELLRATRLKDEFLAMMSHELRTPLNAILGMTEGLQEGVFGEINQRQQKSLTTIDKSGRHLLALINDILDLSKIEANKLELDLADVSIQALCSNSTLFIKEQAHQRHLDLSVSIPDALKQVQLRVDDLRFRQIPINLLSNAVKFTPAGGRVTLEVKLKTASESLGGKEERSTPAPTHYIAFSVSDTGIGIAPENIEKLFQSFVQIDSKLSRQYTGTGLGLSLAKRIAQMHGGTITVSSQVERGSCFTVLLPFVPTVAEIVPTVATDARTATDQRVQHKGRIAIVEDNEANMETTSSYLSSRSYKTIEATSGSQAIELVKIDPPDLILMDIQMPGMDGFEAIERIRQMPECRHIPIVALTALAMPDDRQKCLDAGADRYLSKPIALSQLVKTIDELLASRLDRSDLN